MGCEICGKEAFLVKAKIEDYPMSVCKECSAFGIPIKEEKIIERPKSQSSKEEVIEVISSDYSEKIKKEREKLNLTQKDFARLISEKESVIQSIEAKHTEPSINLARKFEKYFKITLVEEHKEEYKNRDMNFKDSNLTIGDLLNLKKPKQ